MPFDLATARPVDGATSQRFDLSTASPVEALTSGSRTPRRQVTREQLARENPAEYDPSSPEYRKKYGAQGTGGQNVFAGAGKAVVDLGRGARQLGAEAGNLVGLVDDSTVQNLRTRQDEVSRRDSDLMRSGGGVAGNVAGMLATTILPASLAARGAQVAGLARTAAAGKALASPTTYKAAAATGAALGALQPVGEDESRALNTGLGAAAGTAGQAATGLIGRVAQPLTRRLTPQDEKAVRVLSEAGVPLDAAQRSGSKAAELVKRTVGDNPFTAPGQAAFREKQQKAFTRAILRTIGEDADAATPDVMGSAYTRIGKVFDEMAERNPVRYDGKLNAELSRISSQSHAELVPEQYSVIGRQIENIFEKAADGSGAINGEAYKNLRASLRRVSEQRGSLGHWASEVSDAMEDALQRSAGPNDLAALKEARRQWRRMRQIEGAIDTEGAGSISPAKLANSLGTKTNRSSSVYGKGDTELVMLAQAGKRLLPDKFPNSGTTARAVAQAVAPAAIGLGTGIGSGDVGAGLGAGLGSAGLLLGARGGLNNQLLARYFAEGIDPGVARNVLAAPRRVGAAGSAAALPALQE